MTFRLLGPVEVRVDDRPVRTGGPRSQAMLAALLLEANRLVPVRRLVDAAWGDHPPASAEVQVRNRVAAARRAMRAAGLPADVIGTQGSGYLLTVADGQLDLDVFEARVRQSDRHVDQGAPEAAVASLREALALWHGPALDGLRTRALTAAAQRLDERRMTVVERCLDLELGLGRYDEVIGRLLELVEAYPWREPLVGRLMRALYLTNRPGEALDRFDQLRRRLAEELGVDPAPELTRLRDLILRNDPSLQAVPEPPREPREIRGGSGSRPADRPAADAGRPAGTAPAEPRPAPAAEVLWFGLLGPLRVERDGSALPALPPRSRVVLACLLVRAGEAVDLDTLAEEIWGMDPPPAAHAELRECVDAIRRHLGPTGPDLLVPARSGYAVHLAPGQLDAQTFRRLTEAARAARATNDHQQALTLLDRAFALRRGVTLADVRTGPLLSWYTAQLDAEFTAAVEEQAALLLRLDRAGDAVPLLRRHVAANPTRERAHALLMNGLSQAGDPAGALAAYERARLALREQLGIEPGPDLRQAHRAVLTQDRTLWAPGAPVTGPAPAAEPAGVRPRQLPPAPAVLVGRVRERTALRLAAGASRARARPAVLALNGPAGSGKSTLAVWLAHTFADRFPDGHLYLDLQGSTPALTPLTPLAALTRLLTGLGLPASAIAGDQAEAVAQFRSLSASRKVLILLDNAIDANQVAPLLPASADCLVLVTSRMMLNSLDGATHVPVGPLSPAESVRMLAELIGAERVAAEPEQAARLGRLCEHLPLPLRVVGARLAAHPTLPLRRLADRLTDDRNRLDLLELPQFSVRACLRSGYQQLQESGNPVDQQAAQAFRLLAELAVQPFDAAAVSALLDVPPARAEAVAERLVELQLLEPLDSDRYRLHDLLRLTGQELTRGDGSGQQTRAAAERVIAYYVATAWEAANAVRPGPLDRGPVESPHAVTFPDPAAANRWLERELPTLLAVARRHPGTAALDLLRSINHYLAPRSRWTELGELAALARDAAGGDPWGESLALTSLGLARHRLGDPEEALAHLGTALAIRQRIGDPLQATTLQLIGLIRYEIDQPAEAVSCFVQAYRLHRRTGNDFNLAISLHNLGEAYDVLGRPAAAERFSRRALKVRQALGDRFLAMTRVSVGRALVRQGRAEEARWWLDRGIAEAREVGYGEAEWHGLIVRSEVAVRRGEAEAALADLHRAGHLAEGLGRPFLYGIVLRQSARVHQMTGDVGLAESSRSAAREILDNCVTGRDPGIENFLADSDPDPRAAGPADRRRPARMTGNGLQVGATRR
ncbi:BTAD domain-containing putative transcriptional regulator [Micromonospora sp. C28SCA-DRY-2]|uniref:AfsR/SARP family transcriptional regulator n=1 Tax=Micromonospora sp. C28SCA-DRY-2 TaxID=3059522 RepID=UPI0026751B9B|nr:BTAD domain-containing putative transcriptional regulator [Micromonospora sp. C28SCA-DRY-2]MDO3700136.1 BTAD domain-containing putative transcriptional regulator [Micromonospora sp. C28SCA-DRY-2]